MKNANVAIIGSGVAGATVAEVLLQRGVADRITMFEAGAPMKMRDRRSWLDFVTSQQREVDRPYAAGLDLDEEVELDGATFNVRGGRLIAVGGTTLHWAGHCPRMKPEDFQLGSRAGHAIDWPISYDDLAPYYLRAEEKLRVSGDSSRDDPPRDGGRYPIPRMPLTQMDGPVIQAFEALDLQNYGNLPIARNERCITIGTCRYCPVGGRYDATMDLEAMGEAIVLKSNAPVREILMASKSRARGIRYLDTVTGEEHEESFDHVIVCGGTLESAKLLLASTGNGYWPNGIGNDSGHVGRHLLHHPFLAVIGTYAPNPKGLAVELDFPTLECRHYDTPAEQGRGKFYFMREGWDKSIDFAAELTKGVSAETLDARVTGPVKIALRGFVEAFDPGGNRVELGAKTTRFGLPATRIFYQIDEITAASSARNIGNMKTILRAMGIKTDSLLQTIAYMPRADHAACTCRMSESPKDGVVDANLRVHDCENIYVVSNAVFPNMGAVNPTLTLVALALRAAERM